MGNEGVSVLLLLLCLLKNIPLPVLGNAWVYYFWLLLASFPFSQLSFGLNLQGFILRHK